MSIGYINPARNGGFFLLPLLTWCLRENLSNKKGLQEKTLKPLAIVMVPEVGIEPTWSCPRGILSLIREINTKKLYPKRHNNRKEKQIGYYLMLLDIRSCFISLW